MSVAPSLSANLRVGIVRILPLLVAELLTRPVAIKIAQRGAVIGLHAGLAGQALHIGQ